MSSIPPPASSSTSNSSSSSSQFTYSNNVSSYFPVPFHLQPQPYVAAPPVPAVLPSVYPAPPVVVAAAASLYTLPQYHQAHQLFQRDAQTITPQALETVKAALASSEIDQHKLAETKKKKPVPRKAAGQKWEDPTLTEWPENDYRLFCGDLGNEVNDDVLSKAFARFPSFNMAKVVRDKRTGKTKGFGFVSFTNPSDASAALKGMNGKYVGNRPIKLTRSNWKERIDFEALERQNHRTQKKPKLAKKNVLHK